MGWNGSGQKGAAPAQPKVTAKKPSPVRGLVAGAVVVALAAVAYFAFFSGSENPQAEKPDKDRGRIKEVTPAAAPKAAPVATNKVEKNKLETYIDERGVERYKGGLRVVKKFPKPPANQMNTNKHIFKHSAELEIEGLVTITPGKFMIDVPINGRVFLKSFKESLKEEIEILDTDTEEEKEIKRAVITAKKELKDAMDRGEDIVKIMNDSRKELVRLNQYRDQIVETAREQLSKEDTTDQDVADFVEAANSMLTKNGIRPLKANDLTRRIASFQERVREAKAQRAKERLNTK